MSEVRLHTVTKGSTAAEKGRYKVGLWVVSGGSANLHPLKDFQSKGDAKRFQRRVAEVLGWPTKRTPCKECGK
jgi:hypothetical protein